MYTQFLFVTDSVHARKVTFFDLQSFSDDGFVH